VQFDRCCVAFVCCRWFCFVKQHHLIGISLGSVFQGTKSIAGNYWTLLNSLNAELSPICHLLILLGDLTFMGPYIVSIFQYIFNKMQRYSVYLYLETALHI
jgi:hypothetical protein